MIDPVLLRAIQLTTLCLITGTILGKVLVTLGALN